MAQVNPFCSLPNSCTDPLYREAVRYRHLLQALKVSHLDSDSDRRLQDVIQKVKPLMESLQHVNYELDLICQTIFPDKSDISVLCDYPFTD